MATYASNANESARFDQFDVTDLEGESVSSATSTARPRRRFPRSGQLLRQQRVANGDRAERVGVQDKSDIVNIWLDTNGGDRLEKKIAEIHTADVIKIGEDIVLS
jgi:hypothetical protein